MIDDEEAYKLNKFIWEEFVQKRRLHELFTTYFLFN